MANTFTYSDINQSFLLHPNTGDVAKRFDLDAIKASIKSILRTSKGEKLFNPTFGADINKLLFELITPFTKVMIDRVISEEIKKWEPRVDINAVTVNSDPDYNGQIDIDVLFTVKSATPVTSSVTVTLERIR